MIKAMTQRIQLSERASEPYQQLIELIKIRASMLNGCAFCLDLHTRDARKLGETERRSYLLGA
jgi:AhpD family alkylhydroperoxidase